MAHAKIDWQFHIQAYLAQHSDSKSIPDYARANGINTASARRAMRPAVLATLADQVAGDVTLTVPTNVSGSVIKVSRTVRRKALELTAESHQQRADRASSDRPRDPIIFMNPGRVKTIRSRTIMVSVMAVAKTTAKVPTEPRNGCGWRGPVYGRAGVGGKYFSKIDRRHAQAMPMQ